MALPSDLLRRVPEEAVRLIALDRVADLEAQAARLEAPSDPDAVHDVRVALRRLRSTLRSWRRLLKGSVRKGDRAALADVQRSTGAARDAEVGEQRTRELAAELTPAQRRGATWLADRLHEAAERERATLARDLGKPLAREVLRLKARLGTYPARVEADAASRRPRFATTLARVLRKQADRLLEGLARVEGAEDAEAAHAARIEGKRLRYLIEPVAALLPASGAALERLKHVQDELGALQDVVVLAGSVARGIEESALEQARAMTAAARGGKRARSPGRRDVRAGLLALAQRVELERHERGLHLAAAWRAGPEREGLSDALDALVDAVLAEARDGLEIERKYLLSAQPGLPAEAQAFEVEQGWLPGERLQERLRRVRRGAEVRCWRTVKLGRGLQRVEVEEECPPDLFERLWPLTAGVRVTKRRYVVADGTHTYEIDVFLDRDLVLLEVELDDPDEQVELPPWLAAHVVREVTDEDAYVNRRLAR
jgi:CHAD domain-containing protein/CYTH domain-containing protein